MLIVLNGVETIHRKWFAEEIYKTMNTFRVDDYLVKFVRDTYEVTSLTSTSTSATVVTHVGDEIQTSLETVVVEAGEVVYSDSINKLLHLPTGGETLNKIEELFNTTVRTHTRHYANVFVDLEHDLNNSTFKGETDPSYCYPTDYTTLISNYRSSDIETFVISGAFSRHVLDKLKDDLGEDNIKIINIIRHPNACMIAHWKSEEHYTENPNYTKEFHSERLAKSIINAANLVQYPDVETIRFEDIISNGQFTVNGVNILAPENHEMHNQYITKFEKAHADTELPKYTLEQNNEYIAGYDLFTSSLQDLATVSGIEWAPSNIFELLGYTPVDFTTVRL